jgi:AP endonuclease 1
MHSLTICRYILPHGSYLVNLAQDEETKAKQAYDSFLDDLRRCEQLGIILYNFQSVLSLLLAIRTYFG